MGKGCESIDATLLGKTKLMKSTALSLLMLTIGFATYVNAQASGAQKNGLSSVSRPPAPHHLSPQPAFHPTTTVVKQDTSGVDSIYSALESAYQNNPELATEITKINQADERMPQAKAGYRPKVQGTLSVSANKSINGGDQKRLGISTTAQSESLPTAQAGVEVTQNLYAGGATIASVKGAENTIKAARARLLILEQNIFSQVIQVILDMLQKQSEIELYEGNVKLLKQTLNATNDKFTVGEETRTAVAQSQAQLADGVAQLETSRAELEALRATFTKLTGRQPKRLIKPDVTKDMPKTLEQAIQFATENNPTVIAARFEEAAARYEIDRVGAGLLPSIDLRGNTSYNASHNRSKFIGGATLGTGDTRTDMSASVVMTVPLYEQGSVRSQKRSAHEAAAGARISIETQRRIVTERLISAWQNYLAAKTNIENFKKQVEASKVSLDGTQQEMQVGTKILLDVLNAQKELLRSQLNLVRAERTYLFESFAVLAAMGRLTAKQMKLKVNYYDPSIHYNNTKGRI